MGDTDRDPTSEYKIRIHREYDSAYESKIGVLINWLSKILQVYVVQTITFITTLNCTNVQEGKF